jgi:hypothetical protein
MYRYHSEGAFITTLSEAASITPTVLAVERGSIKAPIASYHKDGPWPREQRDHRRSRILMQDTAEEGVQERREGRERETRETSKTRRRRRRSKITSQDLSSHAPSVLHTTYGIMTAVPSAMT